MRNNGKCCQRVVGIDRAVSSRSWAKYKSIFNAIAGNYRCECYGWHKQVSGSIFHRTICLIDRGKRSTGERAPIESVDFGTSTNIGQSPWAAWNIGTGRCAAATQSTHGTFRPDEAKSLGHRENEATALGKYREYAIASVADRTCHESVHTTRTKIQSNKWRHRRRWQWTQQ